MRRFLHKLRSLCRDETGVALTEFATVAPVFLTLGLLGFEIALMASSKMRASQVATSLADNASRLGQTDNSGVTPTITEADVEAVLRGALRQGRTIDLEENGRIILTSLEYDDYTGKQFIHWQRCMGSADYSSAYGDENGSNGLNGTTLDGMGRGSGLVTAPRGEAVMYVEVYYEYGGVFSGQFGRDNTFTEEAAFIVRDDRALGNSDEKGISGTASNEC